MSGEERTPEAGESFGEEYYSRAYNLEGPRVTEINWWSVRFYATLARRLLRRRRGHKMLEIGCGLGFVLARLERDYETDGVEISEYAVEKSRRFAPRSSVSAGDILGDLPPSVEKGRYDLILARYVFEHLDDPARALQRAAQLLAPGGYLLYAVPDTTSPGRRLKGDAWYAFQDETHVSLLDPPEWIELTERAGLKIVRKFSDGLWDVPYVKFLPKLVQFAIFCAPTIVSVLLVWTFLPAGWGENLIVVAQRPEQAPGGEDSR